ncbi:membrane protein insertase YidC [Alkalilimnicola sp. S0819]|uniref:membrane protein insertase YidC n=1 Tax=Alkalilimnicola sp. S0819 TaxID=2613922 RepID=UPI001261612A|nr:membrane protein insertase YidC [Alkalilimnicola sp. S0819]KAB7624227.1 membrane protein insertase YidC [Alkalilimnicola sp. S0819]MPQ16482.1 membrane protein insertase YidC [Alkalilimnicola sp. S0819]
MDNARLFLYSALAILGLLLWTAWQQDFGSEPVPMQAEQQAESPVAAPPSSADEPAVAIGPTGSSPSAADTAAGRGETVEVRTDLLHLEISTRGGEIVAAWLPEHRVEADEPAPFQLLAQGGERVYTAQSGLQTAEGEAPGLDALYDVPARRYTLGETQDELVVPLTWTSPEGVTVTKRYTLRRDSYVVSVDYQIDNATDRAWRAYPLVQLSRLPVETSTGSFLLGAQSFTGAVLSTPKEKYRKIDFEEMREDSLSVETQAGWAGMMEHYFLSAWIPEPNLKHRYYTQVRRNQRHVIGATSPWINVAAGQRAESPTQRLYLGPKDQDRLAAAADNLELTVDYGLLTVISKPLFWLLKMIHSLVGNWGWAIVLLTLLIKIVFYKLSETSYRSMARMRKMQPKMAALKERHGDDRQALNQAMMELYKKEKINPLGGCLPILIQIPVFIALYWVLMESVELRHAPFMLWIQDLSAQDPYYVLPILMGISMLVQQRLNPAPLDPIQQKVMMFLPIIFTVFFLFFPAGLVLYWVTNNTLSIAQQAIITRRVERGEDTPNKGKAGKGKK